MRISPSAEEDLPVLDRVLLEQRHRARGVPLREQQIRELQAHPAHLGSRVQRRTVLRRRLPGVPLLEVLAGLGHVLLRDLELDLGQPAADDGVARRHRLRAPVEPECGVRVTLAKGSRPCAHQSGKILGSFVKDRAEASGSPRRRLPPRSRA